MNQDLIWLARVAIVAVALAAFGSTTLAGFLPAYTGHTVMAPSTFESGDYYLAVSFAVYQAVDGDWTDDWAVRGIDPSYFHVADSFGGDPAANAKYVYFFQIVGDSQHVVYHRVSGIRLPASGATSAGFVRGPDVSASDPSGEFFFPTGLTFLDGSVAVSSDHYGLGAPSAEPPVDVPDDGLTIVGVQLDSQACPLGVVISHLGAEFPCSAPTSGSQMEFLWDVAPSHVNLISVFFFTSDEPPGGFATGTLWGSALRADSPYPSPWTPFSTHGSLPSPVPEPGVVVAILSGLVALAMCRRRQRSAAN